MSTREWYVCLMRGVEPSDYGDSVNGVQRHYYYLVESPNGYRAGIFAADAEDAVRRGSYYLSGQRLPLVRPDKREGPVYETPPYVLVEHLGAKH